MPVLQGIILYSGVSAYLDILLVFHAPRWSTRPQGEVGKVSSCLGDTLFTP